MLRPFVKPQPQQILLSWHHFQAWLITITGISWMYQQPLRYINYYTRTWCGFGKWSKRIFFFFFEKQQGILIVNRLLIYYEASFPITLNCDASPYRKGDCLCHMKKNNRREKLDTFMKCINFTNICGARIFLLQITNHFRTPKQKQ